MPLSELRPGGRSWWRPRGPMPALLVVLLLAFGLRVYELGKLSLYGDFAYSVYAARQGLAAIAQERVLDGHPPLYYYLLHFWMLLSGQTELTTRMLSVLIGMLAVPLAYSFAARRLGRLAGTLGALFVAVSPPLVHYSRLPRMYILLATLGLLSAYALDRALRDGRRRHWLAYFAATSLLLYTHSLPPRCCSTRTTTASPSSWPRAPTSCGFIAAARAGFAGGLWRPGPWPLSTRRGCCSPERPPPRPRRASSPMPPGRTTSRASPSSSGYRSMSEISST
ncbi:MAG: glycosyltransferase family 39 protein [Bacteroidetes bacterium]|nr:glycosyltransferase family 39 protein [Bacteroidota bacterium]